MSDIHAEISEHLASGHEVYSRALGRVGKILAVEDRFVRVKTVQGIGVTTFSSGDKVHLKTDDGKTFYVVNSDLH
jgi:hypothetical protein